MARRNNIPTAPVFQGEDAPQENQSQIASLTATVAALQSQLENMSKLIAAERPAALPARLAQDREAWYKEQVRILSISCLERTRQIAEEKWGASTDERWLVDVQVPPRAAKPDLHPMLIPARSEHEARGRYMELFGILSIDANIKLVATQEKAAA